MSCALSRLRLFLMAAALAASFAARAFAQSSRLTLGPGSTVMVLGKSNIHNWACATSVFEPTLDVDSSAERATTHDDKPNIGLSVTVPIRSLKCGRERMNEDLYRTLKADSFPDIRFVLASYRGLRTLVVPDSFWATAKGELTVAGRTKTVEVTLRGERETTGAVRAEGG